MNQVGQGRVMADVNSMTKKEDMLAGVFRDFNPATMTVEEWGEIEYERMQEQSRLNAQKEMEKVLAGEDNPGEDGGAAADEAAEALAALTTSGDDDDKKEETE